jgi:hypothetical protein
MHYITGAGRQLLRAKRPVCQHKNGTEKLGLGAGWEWESERMGMGIGENEKMGAEMGMGLRADKKKNKNYNRNRNRNRTWRRMGMGMGMDPELEAGIRRYIAEHPEEVAAFRRDRYRRIPRERLQAVWMILIIGVEPRYYSINLSQ